MKISANKGFTLIEIGIVMLILFFLLSSAFVSVTALRKTGNISESKQKLQEIEQALYGFAVAQGRLPCPATASSNGLSNPADPSIAAVRHCNGNAAIGGYIGFVPASTLGIKGEINCDGLLVDPWGRPYRYSVSNSDVLTNPLIIGGDFVVANGIQEENTVGAVPANGMANVVPGAAAPNPALLQICNNLDAACNAGTAATNVTTSNAIAIIFSLGERRPNSARENTNAGQTNVTGSPACGSQTYPLSNDQFYYSAPSREISGSATEFDDIVTWISPNILFNKLLDAGRLP